MPPAVIVRKPVRKNKIGSMENISKYTSFERSYNCICDTDMRTSESGRKRSQFYIAILAAAMTAFCVSLCSPITADAAPEDTISNGIYAGDIDLSGMTGEEARDAIEAFVDERAAAEILLTDGDDFSHVITAGDIGYRCVNESVAEEALSYGKSGDIVQRYMQIKDLTRSPKRYDLAFTIDTAALGQIISDCAEEYDREAVDASLVRTDGTFSITDGQSGRAINQSACVDGLTSGILENWDGQGFIYTLDTDVVSPRGTYEDLSKVTDVLGTYTTSYSTSGSSRSANIANACNLINGTTLYPGEEFSTLGKITPFTTENGYFMAGSYLNGQVVDSLGGGICQVSTTLYNAVLLSELEVTERHNHSMIIGYVKPSMDAAIAESSGKNFKFVNNTEYPIYIDGYTTSGKNIVFTIYGVETRPSTHSVSFESEVLETDVPEADAVYASDSQPSGYSSGIQSAHVGYKARLWKNTYENGVLESRVEVNSSKYNKSPRSITIGVATDNPDIYNMLMAAVATGSADAAAAAAAQAAAILNPAAPEAAAPATAPAEAAPAPAPAETAPVAEAAQ